MKSILIGRNDLMYFDCFCARVISRVDEDHYEIEYNDPVSIRMGVPWTKKIVHRSDISVYQSSWKK